MRDKLSKEEKELLESYENEEWEPVAQPEKERMLSIAKNALVKDKRINIRLTTTDLQQLRAKAAQEGLPYQTLISSIIHKYISGRLKEIV